MLRARRSASAVGLLLLMTVMSLVVGSITYRRVLAETSQLFDYQLSQMAISLRQQVSFMSGDELPARPEDSDFVIQISTIRLPEAWHFLTN